MPYESPIPHRHRSNRTWITAAALTVFVWGSGFSSAWGAHRQGDRFGLRGGIWTQGEAAGVLGRFSFTKEPPDSTYLAVVGAPAAAAPIIEVYGLFDLSRPLWAEISVGWSQRRNVSAIAVLEKSISDSNLYGGPLGFGRVDFIPMSFGLRAIREHGTKDRPHNLYLRGGISMIFATESPLVVNDRIQRGHLYEEGTKGSFGLLLGAGVEHYIGPKFGLVADIAYHFNKFRYSRYANFNLSAFWFTVGITTRVR
ncbi:MAG: hypothetical protein HY304_03485 [candidate division Zixibacteria bacterium]|nr:hypothetical protein [candidate division Zixibacteria bacterium]